MANTHGRGKQSYREFSKELTNEVRYIERNIKSGEEYTSNDVFRFLNTLVTEYEITLRGEGLDVELWGNRATDAAYAKYEAIVAEYGLEDSPIFGDDTETEDENPDGENDEIDANDRQGKDTLFGFPVINKDNKALARAKSKPRKRFFLTLEELEKYIRGVPYVTYIQIIRDENGIARAILFTVEAAKDKKKRKNEK